MGFEMLKKQYTNRELNKDVKDEIKEVKDIDKYIPKSMRFSNLYVDDRLKPKRSQTSMAVDSELGQKQSKHSLNSFEEKK